MNERYLIEYELDGAWHQCATRRTFAAAKSKARAEFRSMKSARMTAVIRKGDPALLRRTLENNFELP